MLSLGRKFMEINYFRLSEKAKNPSPCDRTAWLLRFALVEREWRGEWRSL